jgi:putative acetyltransferase
MIVRDARPGDFDAIRSLLRAAFGGDAEARLVELLRADGAAEIELVAEDESGTIAGHILFSPIAAPLLALALAPLAVLPGRQRSGIGSALIADGHERARARGWQAVFVLGEPDYYRRFGFDAALAEPFDSPYAGKFFMALALDPAAAMDGGPVRHARAFEQLEE